MISYVSISCLFNLYSNNRRLLYYCGYTTAGQLDMNSSKYFIISLSDGCINNLLSGSKINNYISSEQWDRVFNVEDAALIIINTCGYNQDQEDEGISVIGRYQKKYPDKKIIVSGCLPKIVNSIIETTQTKILDIDDISQLRELVPLQKGDNNKRILAANNIEKVDLNTSIVSSVAMKAVRCLVSKNKFLNNIFQTYSFLGTGKDFIIQVSRGCTGSCSYCAIKKAKGNLVSRPLSVILNEFQVGLSEGKKTFWLIGDDVGCWGQDQGLNIVTLLSNILLIKDDFDVVINYFDPYWFIKYYVELHAILSNKKFVNINFPLQSGSIKILRNMRRNYSPSQLVENIQKLKSINKSLVVKTHIMVGFPGETFKDFLETLKYIKHFDLIYVNVYSQRPGTVASQMLQGCSYITKIYRSTLSHIIIYVGYSVIFLKNIFKDE